MSLSFSNLLDTSRGSWLYFTTGESRCHSGESESQRGRLVPTPSLIIPFKPFGSFWVICPNFQKRGVFHFLAMDFEMNSSYPSSIVPSFRDYCTWLLSFLLYIQNFWTKKYDLYRSLVVNSSLEMPKLCTDNPRPSRICTIDDVGQSVWRQRGLIALNRISFTLPSFFPTSTSLNHLLQLKTYSSIMSSNEPTQSSVS